MSERLYSIYYKLRREHDDATIVKSLIHFMSAFYTGPDLKNLIESVLRESKAEPDIRYGLLLALQEDTDTRFRFLSSVSYSDYQDTLSEGVHASEWIKAQLQEVIIEFQERDNPQAILARLDEIIQCVGDSDQPEVQLLVARILNYRGAFLGLRDQLDEALTAYQKLIRGFGNTDQPKLQVEVGWAFCRQGQVMWKQHKLADALASFRENIHRFGNSDDIQFNSILEHSAAGLTITQIETKSLSEVVTSYALWYECITFLDQTYLKLFQTATNTLIAMGAPRRDLGDTDTNSRTCR